MADGRFDDHKGPSAGRRRKAAKRGAHAQGLGRSRGGLATKIHAAADGLGNPVRLIAGPGQENDIKRAAELVEGFKPAYAIADKGYDAGYFHDTLLDAGAIPVIPPKKNRRFQHDYDKDLYKARGLIENLLVKLKQFRRVATRYDKLLANFLDFVKIAAIAIWIR